MPRPTPVSRRERPAKPALSRAWLVSAAVQILEDEGLEKLTMRRLAEELDTGPASLYVYVRNTAELHAAVLDERLGTVGLDPDPAGTWQDRVVEVLRSYLMVLFAHPALARSALVARPSGPHYLQLLETLLRLLSEGEVPPDRAAWAVDLLLQQATATAAEHATRKGALDADDEVQLLAEAIHGVDTCSFPHIAALGDDLLSGGPARFEWALRTICNGVLVSPRPDR